MGTKGAVVSGGATALSSSCRGAKLSSSAHCVSEKGRVVPTARSSPENYSKSVDLTAAKKDPHISAWYKRWLAGEFDAWLHAHPNEPMPNEWFELEPKAVGKDVPVPRVEIDIQEAVEARIREINEKGTYSI